MTLKYDLNVIHVLLRLLYTTGGIYNVRFDNRVCAIGIHYVNITSSVAYPVIEGAAAAVLATTPPGARSAAVCY